PFGGDLGFSTACSIDRVNQACTSVGTYANAGFFHPSYLEHSSKLYQNLSATRVMDSMGLDLSKSAWGMFSQGLVHALPYLVMVLVVMGLTFWQQQQIQNRQTNSAAQNASQQMMMKVMPVMMGVLYIAIPAGVVVYFLVSSLFRVGQQAMVTRTFYTGPNAIVIPPADVDDGKPAEKKNFWSQFKPSEASLPQVGKQAKAERAAAVRAGTAPRSKNGGSGGAGSKGAGTKTGAKSTGRDPKSAGSKPSKPKTDAKSSKSNSGSKSASKSTKQRPTTATEDRSKSTVKSESSTATSSPDDRSGSDSAPSRSAPSRSAPPKPGGSKKRGK
ncbi:MAG: YidC/Oxa1 family membrane protein insertase, partial [Actinobacteria bacterium]|nr:YidC/Oxa1 family membrane protein insertase [Actinomycetota bacterium]